MRLTTGDSVINAKTCTSCNQEKDFSLFYLDMSTGRPRKECKDCAKMRTRNRYKAQRDAILEQKKEYSRRPKVKKMRAEYEKQYRINNYKKKRGHESVSYKRNNKKWIDTRRNYKYRTVFGITIDDYNDMFIEQGGRCAICGDHQKDMKNKLAVDHCHETGIVRGLLCQRCNLGLGMYKDNTEILKNAIRYLELNSNGEKENGM